MSPTNYLNASFVSGDLTFLGYIEGCFSKAFLALWLHGVGKGGLRGLGKGWGGAEEGLGEGLGKFLG